MLLTEQAVADSTVQPLMNKMNATNPIRVPRGVNNKIYTSRLSSSHVKRESRAYKTEPELVPWPPETAIAGGKIIDYGVVDNNRYKLPGQGAPNPLWRAQVKERGVV